MAETGIYKDKVSDKLVQVNLCDDETFPYEIKDLNGRYVNKGMESFIHERYEYVGKQIPLIKPNMNYEMETIEPKGKYQSIGETIGKLVDEKNKQYGDSFNKSSEFLKILFPNGVPVEAYSDMLGIIRVFDKLMRIANGNQGNENGWNDLAGYGILKSEE